MKMKRMLAAGLLGLFTVVAHAQDYPSKPVRILVPFLAGGDVDIFARLVSEQWRDSLGQPAIVENRAGGGGLVAFPVLTAAAPDGYTVGYFVYTMSQLPAMFKALPQDWYKQITPITITHTSPVALVGSNKAPFKNLAELLRYAKANPGKTNVGAVGRGLFIDLFQQLAGIELTQVPYKGAADLQTAVVAGDIDLAPLSLSFAKNLQDSGRAVPVVVLTAKRNALLPSVSAAGELVPGYQQDNWFGFIGPPGMPKPVVNKIYQATSAALKTPLIQKNIQDNSSEVVNMPPDEMGKFIEEDTKKWVAVGKRAKIDPQ